MKLSYDIKGVPRLKRLLKEEDPIYSEPWKKALQSLVDEGVARVQATAPHATGRLRARTLGKLQASPVPTWGVVTNRAVHKGYRYPWALEASKRYHYRSGSRRGQKTKGYFARVRDELQGKINKTLEKAAREVERKWNSR